MKYPLFLLLALLLAGCGPRRKNGAGRDASGWSGYDWSRAYATPEDSNRTEQRVINYLGLLNEADSAGRAAGFVSLFGAIADSVAYDRVADLACSYLYTPDSPLYDEETFLALSDRLIADGRLAGYKIETLRWRHEEASKNRLGHFAADFIFRDRRGRGMRLADVVDRETVLVFFKPGCEECERLERDMMADEELAQAVASGARTVIFIDPYGPGSEEAKDAASFSEAAARLPESWIVGYAPQVEERDLYSLRTSPEYYILSPEGRVLFKGLR